MVLLVGLALASPLLSERVLVEVRDGEGTRTVRGVGVNLERVERTFGFRMGEQVSGVDGVAAFEDVPPGRYRLRLRRFDSTVIRARDDPFARPTDFTVIAPGNEEQQRVVVRVRSGVRTRFVLAGVDAQDRARFDLQLRHRGTDFQLKRNLDVSAEVALLPALWRAQVVPMSGYLLVGVEVDGEPRPRFDPMLDLERYAHRSVIFHSAGEALLEGVVSASDGKVSGEVRAELIEPGAWYEAANDRGGSIFEIVRAAVDPRDGQYRMVLPSGRWKITAHAGGMISSAPAERCLQLAPGDREVQNFDPLRAPAGPSAVDDAPPALEAVVTSPRGSPVAGATVELVRIEPDPPLLVAQAVADEAGKVDIPDPGEGRCRIVAGHADFLEAERVSRLAGDARPPRPVGLSLASGRAIHARASFRDGTLAEEMIVELVDREAERVDVVFFGDLVAPSLGLACADAGLLPYSTSVRVFDGAGQLPSDWLAVDGRGDWVEGDLVVAKLGGVIEIRGPWRAARLVSGGEPAMPVEAGGGGVRTPSIEPGWYQVDACVDRACRTTGET